MDLPKPVNDLLQSVGLQSWVLQVFIVVFLTLVLVFLLKRVLRRVQTKLEHTDNPWNVIAHNKAQGKQVDRTTVDAITTLLRLSVVITATLVALQTLGFSVSGVLAFGGIGGIAVGFAGPLQDPQGAG